MIFSDLVADEANVLCQAVERIVERAQELGLLASPPWSSCQLKLDEDDFAWLLDWAEFWEAGEAKRWTNKHQLFKVNLAERELTSFEVAGALLLVFCAECARREGNEGEVWPAVRWDDEGWARFALAHDELWLDNGAPRGKLYRSLKAGARALGVRHCFRGGNEQEYIGTIRLQFGFTYGGCARLSDWLCGYSWPAPIRDLVRDRQLGSASFQNLWSSLHDLRDGNLEGEAWKERHRNSPWILSDWADEIAHNARAHLGLAPLLDTRVEADAKASEVAVADELSESVAAIWEAQNPPATNEFLVADSLRFRFDAQQPAFCCEARPFTVPPGAPWFDDGVAMLTLYAGQARLGVWLYNEKQRAFISQHKQWKLPLTEPMLTLRLVANSQIVVAKQTLALWDASDGLGLWNAESGRRLDVWRHVPRAGNAYVLLVDGDLSVLPLPARWQEVGERRLLWPDADWWRQSEICDGDQPFWKPLLREEPEWARGLEVSLDAVESLHLGQSFSLRVQVTRNVKVASLRWGGRILRPLDDERYEVTALSSDNLVASLPLQIEVCGPNGGREILARRVPLPLCAVLFRGESDEQWQIADGQETWDISQARQWRLMGNWSESARLCEGGVPFDTVPKRSSHVRPPQTWGAPLSVREPPYGSADTVLELCRSVRDGGLVRAFQTVAAQQINVILNHAIAPDADHSLFIWGQDGAICHVRGDEVVGKGERWMVPFHLGSQSRVLAVGLAYQGVWLGAQFEDDWWSLCPRHWNALDSAEAARFALLLRWMRLPWREAPRPILAFARHWPVEALRMWLGTEANEFDLQFSAADESGQSWVREAFREGFEGAPAQAKAAIAPFGNVMNLLKSLAQADPFLALKFARVLSANYQASAFAFVLYRAVGNLECEAEPSNGSGENWRLTLRKRYYLQNLEEFERRALRLALESERNRCRAAALLFEWLAHDLTHPQP